VDSFHFLFYNIVIYLKLLFARGAMLFGHLARMYVSADANRIPTAVPQSDWKRPAGRPDTFWLATMKNDLSYSITTSVTVKDATELALDRPLWGLFAVCDVNVLCAFVAHLL